MGAPTIESRLRTRLLAVIAPALVGVGVAAVAVTGYVLDAADQRAATEHARDAVRALDTERLEGDSFDDAAAEVLSGAEGNGVRMAVRQGANDPWRAGAHPPPPSLLSLAPSTCASADDAEGNAFWGCLVRDAGRDVVAAIPRGPHRALLVTLARAMAFVVVAMMLAVVWATRRAMKAPMESLARLVRWSELVEDDHAPPLPQADTEDMQRLAASFDRLVERLFEGLRRERASSAHIAHELRTPLTAIRAELEAQPDSPGIVRARADVAQLERVVEAILVLSSPQAGARSTAVVNVADLVREQAPPETRVEAPEEALVDGDARLLGLALHNLLDNAKKYSGHEARAVRVSREGERARIAVVDDGPGLPAEARRRMFERYWRAASDDGGRGLGLSLVRAVAERHGGKAEAVPNAGGPGLTVAMTLGPVVGWHDARPGPAAT